ncbi:type IV pilus modification protein PilV [Chitinibacter fontanus]|uniref:Type IV pilus modification protein PilV n=1 Tax=Chitinibacter fontanus TaxID=1737446 RepID=A0A7D5Z1I1_9NEIS|nr:type IV pilus modification protein PilV [Chitinibacter fontanus]QLI80761.1 type IV pilus modification protein PilV [Chitinibacter fontanus]
MKQTGMIMIEVLVSLVVLAIGILGLASLQAYSLRATQSSYLRSVATDLASSLSEQVQANRAKTIASQDAGGDAKYYGTGAPTLPKAPDYARFTCSVNASTHHFECENATGYTPESSANSTALARTELGYWLDLVAASLPLGTSGGAVICRDTSPDDGSEPVLDSTAADFAAKTGCLASNNGSYASAPYVIKIWWQDEKPTKANPTPDLMRFALTIS